MQLSSPSKGSFRQRTDIFAGQTLLQLNIDIRVNFELAVATKSRFGLKSVGPLKVLGDVFAGLCSALENVLRVHHTLERATTGASGSSQ